jgi:hypothetical protein
MDNYLWEVSMSRLLALLLVLLALAAVHAVEPQIHTSRVEVILAAMTPNDRASQLAAEEALVKEGKPALPEMKQILATDRRVIVELHHFAMVARLTPEGVADLKRKQEQLAAEVCVLDQAIFRIANGVNPRQAILDWAHALPFPDGGAFTREFEPMPVADAETGRMEHTFPNQRFYLVYLPGYQGGAAPSEEILRHYAVPAPLSVINLIAVDTAGKLTLVTQREEVQNFFPAAAPVGTSSPASRWRRRSPPGRRATRCCSWAPPGASRCAPCRAPASRWS